MTGTRKATAESKKTVAFRHSTRQQVAGKKILAGGALTCDYLDMHDAMLVSKFKFQTLHRVHMMVRFKRSDGNDAYDTTLRQRHTDKREYCFCVTSARGTLECGAKAPEKFAWCQRRLSSCVLW